MESKVAGGGVTLEELLAVFGGGEARGCLSMNSAPERRGMGTGGGWRCVSGRSRHQDQGKGQGLEKSAQKEGDVLERR